MVSEILALGFDTIEISHGLKVSLLPGIIKMVRAGHVKVSGVHNFCPSPVELMIDAPDAYEFTGHRLHDRDRALALSLKSIEFCAEVGGNYLVMHLGSVPMKETTTRLERLLRHGKVHSSEYVDMKLNFVRIRERMGEFYLKRAREALTKLIEHAEKHQVVLGLESRSHFEQVPTEREMFRLMQDYASPAVGYWHDFGHVQRKHNLGLLNHSEWLGRMTPVLVGCHLHDVIWPERDHRVPFQGQVDFDELMPLVPTDVPVVWELGSRRNKEDILEALPRWKERFAAWS